MAVDTPAFFATSYTVALRMIPTLIDSRGQHTFDLNLKKVLVAFLSISHAYFRLRAQHPIMGTAP
ncbi:hypothetical protein CE163_09200 [Bifidobacterium breve]|nr:hypothetical protein CE163_09200 [Bifidobacterium breve]